MKKIIWLALIPPVVFSSVFCSKSGVGTNAPEDAGATFEAPAVFSKFTDNVTIYAQGDEVVLASDNIPNHTTPYFGAGNSGYAPYDGSNVNFQLNPNRIVEQNIVLRIPVNPAPAANKQSTPLGPIGLSVNGVVLFNQFAGPNQPLTNEIDSFDQHNGHPQQTGQYHYHVEPLYLTATSGRASLIGFLLDGYPVYGPQESGTDVSSTDLDIYHGHSHSTAEYPNGIYHYHITDDDPYINGGQFYGTPGSVTN